MKIFFTNQKFWQRFFEVLFPLTTWGLITLPIWLSPLHPAVAAYFILGFDIYFFYKSLSTAFYSMKAFSILNSHQKMNWKKIASKEKGFKRIYQLVIIVNHKESVEKVSKTLQFLHDQSFPKNRMMIVLAMEKREKEAEERAKKLAKNFGRKFGQFWTTYHPLLKGEVAGKASNAAFAAKTAAKKIKALGIDERSVIVTSSDADSLFHKHYFSYLTWKFLQDKERYFHFYWAPLLLYSNFWEVPLLIRLQATLSSIVRLSLLPRMEKLIQISTYSLSLTLLREVGFWDTNIIPEDWHLFLQAFFKKGPKVKTLPIYLPNIGDAVKSTSLWRTFRSRYEQERRWAWGTTDVPYAFAKSLITPHIPFLTKINRLFHIVESHLFWPSSFFLLTLGASIPPLVNPVFSRTTLGHSLPRLSGLILTATSIFMIVLIYIDARSRPPKPRGFPIAKTPLLIFQWLLLPVVSFFFSSLPALDAHTRLLFGKRLEYKVTEKN